ncbi:MAG: hypothetical protein ACYC8T_30085, partial [Myxococcaceae bacterium]
MLDPVRVRVRRFQLVLGMGFLAFVIGAIISSALLMRVQPRVQALGSPALAFVVLMGVSRLWVWAVLPAICYGAARILDLRPWTTAIGAALTGELFLLAIEGVSSGLEGLARPWPVLALQVATLVGGVLLTRAAVAAARAAAVKTEAAA